MLFCDASAHLQPPNPRQMAVGLSSASLLNLWSASSGRNLSRMDGRSYGVP